MQDVEGGGERCCKEPFQVTAHTAEALRCIQPLKSANEADFSYGAPRKKTKMAPAQFNPYLALCGNTQKSQPNSQHLTKGKPCTRDTKSHILPFLAPFC